MKSPRSTSLSSLMPSHKEKKFFQVQAIHLALFTFIIVFFVIWVLFYTFHFSLILSDDDFLTDFNTRGVEGDDNSSKDDKILSDKGRTSVFLWSFGIAAVVAIFVYVYTTQR